jgi:hypothetical protein
MGRHGKLYGIPQLANNERAVNALILGEDRSWQLRDETKD